jgi:hypothetical protein
MKGTRVLRIPVNMRDHMSIRFGKVKKSGAEIASQFASGAIDSVDVGKRLIPPCAK